MSRVHVFADESGNFDFSRGRGASRYFILTAVTLRDCLAVNTQLLQLRHQMAWEGHDHPGPFHASTDPAPVRDRVFGIIEAQEVRVDSLIVEKAKAMPRIRSSEESFYQHVWFYLMSYVAPRLACTEMLVVSASLGGKKKKRQAFYDTVRSVMSQVSRRNYKNRLLGRDIGCMPAGSRLLRLGGPAQMGVVRPAAPPAHRWQDQVGARPVCERHDFLLLREGKGGPATCSAKNRRAFWYSCHWPLYRLEE